MYRVGDTNTYKDKTEISLKAIPLPMEVFTCRGCVGNRGNLVSTDI